MPAIEADLTHEDKERKDRVPVVGQDVVDVPAEEVHRAVEPIEDGEADETDKGHGEAQLDARSEKEEQDHEADDADDDLIHVGPSIYS